MSSQENQSIYKFSTSASLHKVSPTVNSAVEEAQSPSNGSNIAPNFCNPGTVVQIHVGKDDTKKTFAVHEHVISHYSHYFDAAFRRRFNEDEKQEMALEDIDPFIFGIFVNWLYNQKIATVGGDNLTLIEQAKLWVFARRYLIMDLANQAWNVMVAQQPYSSPEIAVKDFQDFAYASEYEPLQQIAIQKALGLVTVDNVDQMMESFPKRMLADFVKGLVQDRHAWKIELMQQSSALGVLDNRYPAVFHAWS